MGSVSDLIALAMNLQRDLTGIKARMSELQRGLAALPAQSDEEANGVNCPRCGLNLKSTQRLEEHLADVHAEGLDEVKPPPQLDLTAQSASTEAQSASEQEQAELARLDLLLPIFDETDGAER